LIRVSPSTSTNRAMSQKSSKADKLLNLFDNDWKMNKSTVRIKGDRTRSYDPAYSWDARSDNPNSFSRLQATEMPAQPCKPITMSGAAVIELEYNTGFDALNVKQHPRGESKIPLTVEQRDVGMRTDLSGTVPIATEARASNQVVVVDESLGFRNNQLAPPKLVQVNPPHYMEGAGPQCDQKLLNPKQRREIMEYEKRQYEANHILNAAVAARTKTRNQITGTQYHRGVLMVDSSDNMNSEVYGDRARQDAADKEYKAQIQLERMSRLANKRSSMHTNGNFLVPDTVGPRVKTEKNFQSKGGDYHALSFDETYNRLFCRLQGAANADRTQRLRDVESSGKEYNITHHTLVEHWPPKNFERDYNKVLGHPSQVSLEMQRSLQGTLGRL